MHHPLLTPDDDSICKSSGPIVVVTVSGELDITTAPLLAEELREVQQSGSVLVVDLRAVEFMDSAGLRVLIDAADAQRGDLYVIPGGPQVQKLFKLTGTDQLLRILSLPQAA